MSLDYLLQDGLIYFEGEFKALNIGIKGKKIAYIGSKNKDAQHVLDCSGLHILPGAIDTQVHFREPGLTHKDDIFHGSLAALHGGITGFFEMPNTKPSTTTAENLKEKLKIAAKTSHCDYAFYAGATQENLSDLKEMESLPGCCGIKIFMGSSTGSLLLYDERAIKEVLQQTKSTIAVHAEDEDRLVDRKRLAIEAKDVSAHPLWRDEISAIQATEKILRLAKESQRKVHVLHITTKQEVEILKNFKDVSTFEITPQHLFLATPEAYERLGSLAQMNPPIRTQEHQDSLWKAVREAWVDVIGSDHAPHTLEEKGKTYPDSPSGMPGVQTILPLLLHGVSQNKLSLERLTELLCVNPIEKFGITNRNLIIEGGDATLSIVDLNKEWLITKDWLKYKCGWSPFENQKLKGYPTGVILHGNLCLWNGQLKQKASAEKLIFNHNSTKI